MTTFTLLMELGRWGRRSPVFFTVDGALGVTGLRLAVRIATEREPNPGEQNDPIHKLTQHEIFFGAGYKMTRIDLSEVDKPR